MGLSDASCGGAREAKLRSLLLKTLTFLLLAICLVSPVSAKYSLEEAETHITVNPRGVVHVEESVSYVFDGKYFDVHRELKTLPGGSIENVEAHFSDKECELLIEPTQDGYRLIGLLPDPTPERLTFHISYDCYGAVKVYRDVSELNYKLWGGEWEKPLKKFKGSVMLPVKNESEIRYWIHPADYTREANVKNDVILLRTDEIPSTQWYEIRAVFPRIASPNSDLVQVDNSAGLEKILAIESEYQKKGLILEDLYSATVLFALFVLAFPIFIYYRYGREPEIDHRTISKRDIFADSKPAVVNAVMKGSMGIPTIDGFTATILDLVNRGYISFRNLKPEEKDLSDTQEPGSRDFMVELPGNEKDPQTSRVSTKLEDFEEDVLSLLKAHASEGKISWKKFEKELQNEPDSYKFLIAWSKKVQAYTAFDKFFQSTGHVYMYWFSRLILIAAIVYYILITGFFPSKVFPLTSKICVLTASIGIYGFIMTKFSNTFITVFGRWTPEGNLYYKHWNNFKKYITDLSALKEHPPESVEVWDSYFIYAVSLGVAKEMLQNISQIVPPEQLKRSRFHPISCNYYSKSGYDTEMPSHHPIKEEMETEEAGNIGGGFEENSGTE
ncbi:MAG TPA: DUF2207 domain-containing protein [Methanosarcina thermophila]|nr:DUF2207 domain-containing protein [Methanosarcina thermophila]HPT80700.1 DUF2207 domain-containing protein [Methanosarcina thermophila]